MRLWCARNRIAEKTAREDVWRHLIGRLRQLPAPCGTGFTAKEFAQDCMLATGWGPRDRDNITPVGKGALRGLDRLHCRPANDRIKLIGMDVEYWFLREVRELFAIRASFYRPTSSSCSSTISNLTFVSWTSTFAPRQAKVSRSGATAPELQRARGHHVPRPSPQIGFASMFAGNQWRSARQLSDWFLLVGAGRFELPTPCSRSKCATRLRYAPPDRFVARDMGNMPV
jgi:hypothetical protein